MASKINLESVYDGLTKVLRTPAGQTAGKTAAVVGGASIAAYAIPSATGAGLTNLGGGGNGIIGKFAGLLALAVIALIAVYALPPIMEAIKK